MLEITFDTKLPLIAIEVYIERENEKSLVMALDTGCSRTIIPYEIAVAIGCDPAGSPHRTRIVTGSGVEIAPVVTLKSIRTLGKVMKDLDVACHDLPEEGFVDGSLGPDFLRNFKFMIDFKKGIIELT